MYPSSQEYYCTWGENRIISGYQYDKSFKAYNLNGLLEYSMHCHTDLVTSVCTVGNSLITGSADSFMYIWHEPKPQEKSLQAIKGNKLLGHNSKILQIRGIELYQIIISLGQDGIILIHDLRNGELIRGIKDNAIGIAISNLGIIVSYNDTECHAFTINESSIIKKKININKALFDISGENLYYSYDNVWGFFNIFDDHKKFEQIEDLAIKHIQLPIENEYFIHSQVGDNINFVLTFELMTKESYRVIRRHNLLQD